MANDLSHQQLTAGPITLVTVAETVGLACPAVQSSPVGQPGNQVDRILISGHVNVTQGTNGTGVIVRVRQGAVAGTGTVIGVPETHSLAAGLLASIPFSFEDASGLTVGSAGGQYCVTCQLVAASANGSINSADMLVSTVT